MDDSQGFWPGKLEEWSYYILIWFGENWGEVGLGSISGAQFEMLIRQMEMSSGLDVQYIQLDLGGEV